VIGSENSQSLNLHTTSKLMLLKKKAPQLALKSYRLFITGGYD
jgi:hypothetical protein